MTTKWKLVFAFSSFLLSFIKAVPEPGVKEFVFEVGNGDRTYGSFAKSLFKDAVIDITLTDDSPKSEDKSKPNNLKHELTLVWHLLRSDCAQMFLQVKDDMLPGLIHSLSKTSSAISHYKNGEEKLEQGKHIHITLERKIEKKVTKTKGGPQEAPGVDGNYLLVIGVKENFPKRDSSFTVRVKVSIKMNTGYLSAAEWPLLPFYGAMSLVYLAYGVVWLIVSACQWRELLRIQFWIGGVIAVGMLEKAVFFSEYNNVNDSGVPAHGLVVSALVLSSFKCTLSRILIIIVSMGFGIVKPRLGAALHRVLGVGCLYFILSIIEGSYRELGSVNADFNRKQMIASVPLSVLDIVICCWIFVSLLQTKRTLRTCKNLVKLSLYRHFSIILSVSVVASMAFMLWVIKTHSFNECIQDWKNLWIDDAFWHFLFALILLAIMVLWRPTANQRYAFASLIDVGEDDEEDMTLSDAFQVMKMRNREGEVSTRAEENRKKAEDDLKWVEENIPTSGGIDTLMIDSLTSPTGKE